MQGRTVNALPAEMRSILSKVNIPESVVKETALSSSTRKRHNRLCKIAVAQQSAPIMHANNMADLILT
jgi:hypothetical protein